MSRAALFALAALGRLRRGTHYVVDAEPDDPEDGPPSFGDCTPESRGVGCPLCLAAAASGKVPEEAVEAYRVSCSGWLSDSILPDLRSALDVIGEELEGAADDIGSVEFSVSRVWMLRAEMDRLREFEG